MGADVAEHEPAGNRRARFRDRGRSGVLDGPYGRLDAKVPGGRDLQPIPTLVRDRDLLNCGPRPEHERILQTVRTRSDSKVDAFVQVTVDDFAVVAHARPPSGRIVTEQEVAAKRQLCASRESSRMRAG